MKIKYEPKKRKPIKEVPARKNFSGEASPYWDFVNNRQREGIGDHQEHMIEDTLANPDVLSEEDNIHNRELSEDGETKLRIIQEMMAQLSPQQQRAVQLCGVDGLTLKEAAEQMGVKLATVQVLLKRARSRILKKYDSEKKVS